MNEYQSDAYKAGYAVGKRGGTWFECRFTGRMMTDWLRGFDDGRNDAELAKGISHD